MFASAFRNSRSITTVKNDSRPWAHAPCSLSYSRIPLEACRADDQTLKNGFETHLAETKGQIVRLEKVFKMHGVEVKGVDCPAIDGILDEASEIAGEVDDKQVLDAALIAAAQAVEHYEITRYGTLIAWAKKLRRDDCAAVLQQNLEEEKAADQKLNALALGSVNQKAA